MATKITHVLKMVKKDNVENRGLSVNPARLIQTDLI